MADQEIIPPTGALAAAGQEPIATVEEVIGRELQATQVARGQDVIYRETAHYPLNEAEFYLIVDAPPPSHQWLPTVRGAWLASALVAVTPVLGAMARGTPVSLSLVSDASIVAMCISSLLWLGVGLRVRFGPDRRRDTIQRIRRTWPNG
jgi:hypothetical protein